MKTYFECKLCPFVGEYTDTAPLTCPQCNSKFYRLRYGKEKEKNNVNIDGTSRGVERLSGSMACLPSEVPAMMAAYPGSEYRVDDTGLAKLVIKNRQHKLQEMKRRGYAELD